MSVGEVADASCPESGVLLQVTACGICGTDVRAFYNGDRRISAPWVLGHEISGKLIDIGSAATDEAAAAGISIGDSVHCISTLWCGRCRLCRSGNEHLCVNGELMGFDHPGAYAELVAIPQIALKNLFRIPAGLSDAHATFADPLSDAICGHKDIAVSLDDTVVVIGAGPVGTAHALIARLEGAGHVLMMETAARRLELARQVLGDERLSYIDTSSGDGVEAVREATDGIGGDVVIVACSSDIAQEEAMEMAAPRGRVLFFGGLPKGTTHMRFPSNILHYREVQVHGSYASRHRDQVHALDMLADDLAGIRRIVTLTLFPHYSKATTGSSMREFTRLLDTPEWRVRDFDVTHIDRYAADPRYLNAMAESVTAAWQKIPADLRKDTVLLFSAHGLPQKFIDAGDPYVDETEATRLGILERLPFSAREVLAYQSRTGPVKWIGPGTEEMLVDLAHQGVRNVLVVPLSFVSDHIETLYEVDMLFAEAARKAGITGYWRTDAMNTSPRFLAALAGLVEDHVGRREAGGCSGRCGCCENETIAVTAAAGAAV